MRILMSKLGTGSLPTGLPVIDGARIEDSTLTANTDGVSHALGVNNITYVWYRDEVQVSTASSVTMGDSDVGTVYRLEISFVTSDNKPHTLSSSSTSTIANINDVPTGVPTIIGNNEVGSTMTANVSNISDDDGLGAFSYQWLRNGVDINGAISSTYTTSGDDISNLISVKVSWTDGYGMYESVTSSSIVTTNVIVDSLNKTITASRTSQYDYLGSSLSMSGQGNIIVIGVPSTSGNSATTGRILILQKVGSSWNKIKEINATDTGINLPNKSSFGANVSTNNDGTTIIATGIYNTTNFDTFYTYVITRTGTSFSIDKLPVAGSDGYVNGPCALSGNGNTIGILKHAGSNIPEALYIYRKVNNVWTFSTKIAGYTGAEIAISDDGNRIVVGDQSNNSYGTAVGRAYIFSFNGTSWGIQHKIHSNYQVGDYFGSSVAISGDGNVVAIGSWGDDYSGNTQVGAVYVYKESMGWAENKVVASPRTLTANFGSSVALDYNGDVMFVGANGYPVGGQILVGKVHQFHYTTSWVMKSTFGVDLGYAGYFGSTVSTNNYGTEVVVGAGNSSGAMWYGKAYIYN